MATYYNPARAGSQMPMVRWRWTRVFPAALSGVVLVALCAYGGRLHRDGQLVEAVKRDDLRAVTILLRQGADYGDAPRVAALYGRADVVRVFLRERPELAHGDRGGELLCSAALGGDLETLRSVLVAHPPLDWRAPRPATDAGMTAVMFAARSGRSESVAALAQAGADLTVRCGISGRTALMLAAVYNTPEALRTLLLTQKSTAHVGIDDRDAEGRTALLLAARAGRYDTVDYLLRLHANPNLRDGDGKTALALAIESGAEWRVLARLRTAGAR